MASVTSLSDEDLILLYDLKTTCLTDGYSCTLSNDNFTVTAPEQLSYWLKEITYSELSPESAALFKTKVYYCDCCATGNCSSSITLSCRQCDEPYYNSNDYFTLYKNGSILYSFISHSDVKKEYEARGLNTSTEEENRTIFDIVDFSYIYNGIQFISVVLFSIFIYFKVFKFFKSFFSNEYKNIKDFGKKQ